MMSPPREAVSDDVVRWINRIVLERDCSIPPPDLSPPVRAVLPLLRLLSDEFRTYRTVVAGGIDAARRNEAALVGIVAAATSQADLIRTAAAAVAESSGGASRVARAAEELQHFAVAAAAAADGAAEGLADVRAALTSLAQALGAGSGRIGDMDASAKGVAHFIATLGRLSRQAQLLSVNAAIESAHLAEAGTRFALVALEVRKLSVSTREAAGGVGKIVKELAASTARAGAAVAAAAGATTAAAADITGAGATLAQTRSTIGEFEEKVADVASVASEQRASLGAVADGIAEIARRSSEAATAAGNAGQDDVTAPIDHARRVAAGWTEFPATRDAHTPEGADSGAFGAWVHGLMTSADRSLPAGDPLIEALGPPLLALVARADADALEILSDVVQIARAVSANGFAWQGISRTLDRVRDEIRSVRIAVGESAEAARTAAERSAAMRTIVDRMQLAYDEALGSLDGALDRVSGIARSVSDVNGYVDTMSGAAEQANGILALIDTLTSETDLLSLNAAIEAAHAGDAGRGFGVIAEEIRTLAVSTNESTRSVEELVARIAAVSNDMRGATSGADESTAAAAGIADRVRSSIGTLRESFAATLQRALDVFETAQNQARALDAVADIVVRSGAAVDDDATTIADRGRVELATIGARIHAGVGRRPRGLVVETVRAFADRVAGEVEGLIEAQLTRRAISEADLFELDYVELVGSEIRRLGRLFDVQQVPPEGFSPPKFRTPWDEAIDEPVIDLLDQRYDDIAAYDVHSIAVFDLNSFLWAQPRRRIADWTGTPEIDRQQNRLKRMVEDEFSLRVARASLGAASDQLGRRLSYPAFTAAGCALDRPAGERPWGAYVYARDAAEVYNEVVAGIFVRGRRHSTLRLAYGMRFT
jgi:methyl-accepting chemotaxis protein